MDKSVDRIADPWGGRTAFAAGERWPSRVDTHLAAGISPEDVQRWVPTASLLHSNGDAMDMAVIDGRIVSGSQQLLKESGPGSQWELLTGLAKAVKDEDLLEMANMCIQRSQRQSAWMKAMLKTASPQVLTVANR